MSRRSDAQLDADPRVEAVARATHAHNNSGVTVPYSPLSWDKEQPYMRKWHRAMAAAALAVADAGLCDCPLCPDRTHGGERG